MYNNKKIFILGMARSGYAAAKLLANNNQVTLNDMDTNQDEEHIKELESLGVKVVLGSHPDDLLTSDYDLVIKNPGIKENHQYIAYAYQHNIKVINEVELAFHYLPKNVDIVGITGSNGKTTTSSMLAHVLDSIIGCNYIIGDGNGHANKENKKFIIESCEYRRHFLNYDIEYAIITNIEMDHGDYYKDIFDMIDAYQEFANNEFTINL